MIPELRSYNRIVPYEPTRRAHTGSREELVTPAGISASSYRFLPLLSSLQFLEEAVRAKLRNDIFERRLLGLSQRKMG